MRTPFLITAALGLAMLAAGAPAGAQINQRQHNQQQRIANGIRSGALTPHETYRLERQQAHIARYEARSRADGPGLTLHERARIDRMQDRASANIGHQKHDPQGRW